MSLAAEFSRHRRSFSEIIADDHSRLMAAQAKAEKETVTMPIREGGTNPKDLVGAKKAPLALVPAALVIGASEAMENGAEKYGPFNWREYPVQIMTYCEAIQRHLAAFVDGQDNAEDTGIHHLKHIAASIGILLDSIALGIAVDNRPPKGPAADILRVLDKTQGRPLTPAESLVVPVTNLTEDQIGSLWSEMMKEYAEREEGD